MQGPLAPIQPGQAAIHVFFVMSACVLAGFLDRDRSPSGLIRTFAGV